MSELGEEAEGNPELRLRDLRAGLPPVHVLGRIVSVTKKEVTGRTDGRRRTVLSGLLTDGTATVRFTWWDPPSDGVDPGTVLRAVNAQVREFRHRPELSFGWSTRVQPASELEIPPVDPSELPLRGLATLEPGEEGYRLEARVQDVIDRTVTVREDRRTIHSGHLSDGTGTVPFTAWVDFRLRPGDTVRIIGGYVRRFRGVSEVTLDERTHVEAIPNEGVAASPAPTEPGPALGQLAGGSRGTEVRVLGRVVALGSPSGVVHRCSQCGRVLRDGLCRVHAAVEGVPDFRVRLMLDDGTGVAAVDLSRALSEAITGTTLEQLLTRSRQPSGGPALEREIRSNLLGQSFGVTGRVRVDEFGTTLVPTSIDRLPPGGGAPFDRLVARLAGLRR